MFIMSDRRNLIPGWTRAGLLAQTMVFIVSVETWAQDTHVPEQSGSDDMDSEAATDSSGGLHLGYQTLPEVGRVLTTEALEKLAISIFSDGSGLPEGQGNVGAGGVLYKDNCASCHGDQGQGGRALELTGDLASLKTALPDRGIIVRWPNAPALFDYIRRAMPPDKPWSFNPNEVYSVVGYVLYLNGLLAEDAPVDAQVLANLAMPAADFYRPDPSVFEQ